MADTRGKILLRSDLKLSQLNTYKNNSIRICAPNWLEEALQAWQQHAFTHIQQDFLLFDICDSTGSSFNQPYTLQKNVKMTLRDLQILARNETYNTNGAIAFYQYGILENHHSLIYSLKDLVRHTIVIGKTQAVASGGYRSKNEKFNNPQDVYICDLAGLQFQTTYNSGRLVLINADKRHPLPAGILDDFIFERTVGEKKHQLKNAKKNPERYGKPFEYFGYSVYFDRYAMSKFVQQDVMLYALMLNTMCLVDEQKIEFKFVRYGAGFFAEGLPSWVVDSMLVPALHIGIKTGLEPLFKKGIKQFSQVTLPFYEEDKELIELCSQYNVKCVFNKNDALKRTNSNIPVGTTNAADPHAVIRNELGHSSVDASIGTNLKNNGNEFVPLLNPELQMEYVKLPALYPARLCYQPETKTLILDNLDPDITHILFEKLKNCKPTESSKQLTLFNSSDHIVERLNSYSLSFKAITAPKQLCINLVSREMRDFFIAQIGIDMSKNQIFTIYNGENKNTLESQDSMIYLSSELFLKDKPEVVHFQQEILNIDKEIKKDEDSPCLVM